MSAPCWCCQGVVVPLNLPFFAVIGVAPLPSMGHISASPPGVHTGNIDKKDLVARTTLFMPIHAAGALFSVGDAHAAGPGLRSARLQSRAR
jgi:acetamidase/formamidase